MIRNAEKKDIKTLYNLKKMQLNSMADSKDMYFQHIFDCSNTLVNEINGQIKASLQMDYFPVVFEGRRIMSCFFTGQLYDGINMKYFDQLLSEYLKQAECTSLLSGIFYNDSTKYALQGFKRAYRQRLYDIKRSQLREISCQNVSRDFTVDELYDLYNDFTSHFNGYIYRSRQYWEKLLEYYDYLNYYVAVYRDEKKQPKGYMIYYADGEYVRVEEIIYKNGIALLRLLAYGTLMKPALKVKVSEYEDLSLAIESAQYELIDECEMKINDIQLFNELNNWNVMDISEAVNKGRKPLWISRGY